VTMTMNVMTASVLWNPEQVDERIGPLQLDRLSFASAAMDTRAVEAWAKVTCASQYLQ
jgi:hypothetical protein